MLRVSSKQIVESRNYTGINWILSSSYGPQLKRTQYLIDGRSIVYVHGTGSMSLLQEF